MRRPVMTLVNRTCELVVSVELHLVELMLILSDAELPNP